MSETISGTVSAMRQDRKAVKINDEWYSVKNASAFGECNKGDTLTAQFSRNGKWNNLDESSIKVAKGHGGGGGSKGGGGGNSNYRAPEEMMRETGLKVAFDYLSSTGVLNGDYASDIEALLKTADLFTAYQKGLIDLSGGVAPAPAPAPQPEPEPEPEPQQAAPQPSALSSFLGK